MGAEEAAGRGSVPPASYAINAAKNNCKHQQKYLKTSDIDLELLGKQKHENVDVTFIGCNQEPRQVVPSLVDGSLDDTWILKVTWIH